MDTCKMTYDISRCYLKDRSATLPEQTYNRILGAIRARDHAFLAACSCLYRHEVSCREEFRTLLQIEAFFKKNASFTEPLAARLSALLSFEEGERLCELTNHRLDKFPYDEHGNLHDFAAEVAKMQWWIEKVLGRFLPFLEQLPKLGKITAGATATRPRRDATPFKRLSKRLVCTPGAFPYLQSMSEFFGYGALGAGLVSRNRVTFVPKSWKTERTIACEAEGNVFLQLAFDTYAKRSLMKVGINLHDQTRNQELAKEGSISGDLATIDLSMASDTLAYNTVSLLFPDEWFRYLRSIRSQYYELYPGRREAYHKFSSMGNGATFTVETLVFAAACSAVGSKRFSVYGDDIIIERELASDLIALLDYLGFIPNADKTFTSGPFRESCGVNCFDGVDITPVKIEVIDDRKAVLCHLVNTLAGISKPEGELWSFLSALVKSEKLPLVPFNEDTMSGVWVDPSTAYERKLIRTARKGRYAWMPRFKAYKAQQRVQSNHDLRSLTLWFFGTYGKRRREAYQSSRYTLSSHKYVRKWVHWKLPVVGAPDHLSWWSDHVTRTLSS